ATASIGQVHAALLPGGEPVVVKVQKPGIQREVELDLLILRDLTHLLAEYIDAPSVHGLEEVVEQFSDSLREELDYVREGRNADRFRTLLGTTPRVVVPRVHWELTTTRVLTMQRIGGVKITDLDALRAMDVDRRELARHMADLVLCQVLERGFFHADPHPGNYFVQAGGTIGIVDFGMVGVLDEVTRRDLLLLLAAWVKADAEGLADGLLSLGIARAGTELERLRRDMRRLLARYHDAQLGDLNLSSILRDIFALARRHQLVMRGDLTLMAKTVAMYEGIGLVLDPRFNLVEVAQPHVERALRRLYMPHLDAQATALNLGALLDLTMNFPRRAQRLLGRMERGDLGITVRPDGVDPLMRDLNRMVNRLSVSILTAAFIVGLALLLQVVENSHGSFTLLGLFASGLVAAAVLGLWLLLSMWRAGRSH
ncbi:MAG TPA: AarF/UbiB family protein, partial [Chloroflexota bacterium]|nr:AarF/UbiB family protein [Chloroflexota bacterium]